MNIHIEVSELQNYLIIFIPGGKKPTQTSNRNPINFGQNPQQEPERFHPVRS